MRKLLDKLALCAAVKSLTAKKYATSDHLRVAMLVSC